MKLSIKLSRLERAISLKTLVKIRYHDISRTLEPHILGYNINNEPALRVFELVRDNLRTDEFKLYLLEDIQSIVLLKTKFTRTVTKPTDQAMSKIVITTFKNDTKKEKS